jgi:AraC-like DNA-binding protein
MNIWMFIYAIAAAQGLLLCVALWQRGRPSVANRLLAGWMLLVSLDLAVRVWAMADPGSHAFKALRLVSLFPFLYGSLFFLYVRSVIHGRRLRWLDACHGLGFGIALLAIADLLLLGGAELEAAIAAVQAGEYRTRQLLINLGLFAYSLSYVAAALWAIARHRRQLRATRSDSHPGALRWLVVMAACQCAIWAIALAQWLLPQPWLSGRMIYAAVAVWVLLVGYLSLLRTGDSVAGTEPVAAEDVDRDRRPAPETAAEDVEDPRFDEVAGRLRQLMEVEHLFREPALAIAQVARRSGYPEYLVSAVINRRFGSPFWDYVNRYRVEAARERLLDPDEQRTALDIAYDCGFTSKSTFNAAFKRLLGETPSACRRRAEAGVAAAARAADKSRSAEG